MGIITKEVEVRPTGKMIKYYKDKGYDAKYNQPLTIKVEDLPRKSFVHVEVLCDYCNETVCNPTYMDYLTSIEKFGNYACKECGAVHMSEAIMNKYGVSNPAKLESSLRKKAETMVARYGVPYSAQSPELWDKMVKTWERNYGVDNPSKDGGVKRKTVLTCQKKFGVDRPAQLPEIKEKMSKTFYENSSQKCSKQQRYVNVLYNGELNYPFRNYNFDIFLKEDNMDVEIDCGGHNLSVKLGKITQEEFDQKEIMRNNIIKREGYKTMRIVSLKDKLPSDTILLQMLSDARNYFATTNHSWCSYDIDKSLLFNAENKNGTHYDFGTLRKIKDEDLTNQNKNQTIKKGA